MSRKMINVLLVIFFFMLCCQLVFAGGKKEVEKIHLVFRQSDTPSEVEGLKDAIELYNQENPNIHVDFETVPWSDARTQILREASAGTGADVVHCAFVWTRDFGIAGAFRELDSLMESDPLPNPLDDFIAVELTEYEGKHYGIPWSTDTWCLVYREDILKEAGFPTLPETYTWEDFREVSKTIKEKTGKYGFGFPAGSGSGGTVWFLANWYWWSNGINLIERDAAGNCVIGVTVADVVHIMKYLHSFLLEGHSPESMLGISSWADPEVMNNLVEGRQAIGIMPPYTLRVILERLEGTGISVVSAMLPTGKIISTSHLGGRTLGINSATKHPEEAWKLLKFMMSEKVFREYYYGQFPAQKSLLKKIDFGKAFNAFPKQLAQARVWGDYATCPAPIGSMWDATNKEFGSAFVGQKTYEEAAQDLLKTVQDLLLEK